MGVNFFIVEELTSERAEFFPVGDILIHCLPAGTRKRPALIDEFHLDYPTCVDVSPGKRVNAWGDLLGRFAVQAIPHAVAVDGNGTIVACGRLQDVLAKASELVRKTR